MDEFVVEDFFGVGWMLKEKLKFYNFYKCFDLLRVLKVDDLFDVYIFDEYEVL